LESISELTAPSLVESYCHNNSTHYEDMEARTVCSAATPEKKVRFEGIMYFPDQNKKLCNTICSSPTMQNPKKKTSYPKQSPLNKDFRHSPTTAKNKGNLSSEAVDARSAGDPSSSGLNLSFDRMRIVAPQNMDTPMRIPMQRLSPIE
jgi:hypothetical protein